MRTALKHPPHPNPLLKGEGRLWDSIEISLALRERVRERGNTQKGFSAPILLVLLTVGIIAAVWLTQTGVNFLPNAAEQESLNPSAGKTKNCAEAENKDQCQKENDVICAKDTVTYCDNRQGSPRAIRKSGGYYDPSHANTDPASGCVFDYREVSGKNTECGKTESKSGDVVYTTKEEAQQLDSDREKSRPERERQAGASVGTTDAVCTEPGVEQTMKDEKVTGNLVRYYAILAGQPEYCVPADLGVLPKKEAQNSAGQTGRLMLCSKSDSSLTWRVIISGSKLEATTKSDPTKQEAESEIKQNLEEALKVASPTQSTSTSPTTATPARTGTDNIPPPGNGVSIFRAVANNLCEDSCGTNDRCKQYIPKYPSTEGMVYECIKNVGPADAGRYNANTWGILKTVPNSECANVCKSEEKCMLSYIPQDERVSITNTAGYTYFCATNEIPEGRMIPADRSQDEGHQCYEPKQCKTGTCNIISGKDYGVCGPCGGGVCP